MEGAAWRRQIQKRIYVFTARRIAGGRRTRGAQVEHVVKLSVFSVFAPVLKKKPADMRTPQQCILLLSPRRRRASAPVLGGWARLILSDDVAERGEAARQG